MVAKPRKKPSQGRSRATVATILDATALSLAEHGWRGLSTNRVARRAGVSIGSLYQYFPNKQALCAALVERHLDHMYLQVEELVESGAELPMPQFVRHLFESLVSVLEKEIGLHSALGPMLEELGQLDALNGYERRLTTLLEGHLASRRAQLRQDLEPNLAARVVVMSALSVLYRFASVAEPGVEQDVLIHELGAMAEAYLTGALSEFRK